jgi:hypothetical protein
MAALFLLLGASCGIFGDIGRATDGEPPPPPDTSRISTGVMGVADKMIVEIRTSTELFAKAVATRDAKIQSLKWSTEYTSRVLTIASKPTPMLALVELMLFADIQLLAHQRYWMPDVYGEADRPMIESFERLKLLAWNELSGVLDEKQQQALKQLLTEWAEQTTDLRDAPMLDAAALLERASKKEEEGGKKVPIVSDLFTMISVDPLSNLEPAVREVALARQLGERVFFFGQHVPILLAQQVELIELNTATMPEVQGALASVERVSLAAEKFGVTAETLPEVVRTEREAAIKQISDELTVQRQGIVADLDRAREPVQKILEHSREALDAGTRLSEAATITIRTLDEFLARMKQKEPDAPPPSPDEKPFDIAEYGAAAARIGEAARDLTAAITTIDGELPRVQQTLDEVVVRVEHSIDYTYSRLLRLVLWTVGAIAGVILLIRAIWSRLPARSGAA